MFRYWSIIGGLDGAAATGLDNVTGRADLDEATEVAAKLHEKQVQKLVLEMWAISKS